jgi:hypothetical protein
VQPQPAYPAKGKGRPKTNHKEGHRDKGAPRKNRPKPAKNFDDDSPEGPAGEELDPFYRRRGGVPPEPAPVSNAAYAAQQGYAEPEYGAPSQDAAYAPSIPQTSDADPRYGQGIITAMPLMISWVLTRQQNRQHTQVPNPSLPVQDNTIAMTMAPAREAGCQGPPPKTSQPIQNTMAIMAMLQEQEAGFQNPQLPKIHRRRSRARSTTLQLLVGT